jgi:hypothetical protein
VAHRAFGQSQLHPEVLDVRQERGDRGTGIVVMEGEGSLYS